MNMKKVPFLFVLACLFTLVLHAQHRPFVVEGKRWVVEYNEYQLGWIHNYQGKSYVTSPMTYYIEGDTTINEKSYKKVYQKCTLETGRDTTDYYSAIREDADGTVYQKRENYTAKYNVYYEYSDTILYKFSPEPTIEAKDLSEAYKKNLYIMYDSYFPKGKWTCMAYFYEGSCYFKKNGMEAQAELNPMFLYDFVISINDPKSHYSVVDGIGIIETFNPLDFGLAGTLCEVWENDELIYSKDWQMEKIAPEGIHSLQVISNDSDGPTYDLQGRRVENPKQGEIYIQNGKKIRK